MPKCRSTRPNGDVALTQQVRFRVRRAAHAVVPQIGKHDLDRFARVGRLQIVRQHAPSVREDGLRCENPDDPECRISRIHFYHAHLTRRRSDRLQLVVLGLILLVAAAFGCTGSRPGTAIPTSIPTSGS